MLVGLGTIVNAFYSPRYSAPITALLYVVLIQCMRHLRTVRAGGEPVGQFMVRVLPIVCLLAAGLRIAAQPLGIGFEASPALWYGPGLVGLPRASVVSNVEGRTGKHLLIVRYDEWVYNDADIDGSKVVWAREMSREKNRKLIEYFKDRQVWLVEPDKHPPGIRPYSDIDKSEDGPGDSVAKR